MIRTDYSDSVLSKDIQSALGNGKCVIVFAKENEDIAIKLRDLLLDYYQEIYFSEEHTLLLDTLAIIFP